MRQDAKCHPAGVLARIKARPTAEPIRIARNIMDNCPRVSICRFYPQHAEANPKLAEEFRSRYCTGNYLSCARYSVAKALGHDRVPDTLQPNNYAEARRLAAID